MQSSPKLAVWYAISRTEVMEPYFSDDGTANGDKYKRVLRYFLFSKLANYSPDMIFRQAGAPLHYTLQVKQYLNPKPPNGWMGKGGLIPWPARSFDLTQVNSFFRATWKIKYPASYLRVFLTSKPKSVKLLRVIRKTHFKRCSKTFKIDFRSWFAEVGITLSVC